MNQFGRSIVSVFESPEARYPEEAPFHPAVAYPEYPFDKSLLSKENEAYEAVRAALKLHGLDRERFGTPEWNPLGGIVRPGTSVVVKPNLVADHYGGSEEGTTAVLTHGSVVRAILDYVLIALGGRGRITVGDSPLRGTDFDRALERSRLKPVVEFFRSSAPPAMETRVVDFRRYMVRCDDCGTVEETVELEGDPEGYVPIDLGEKSALRSLDGAYLRYRAPDYDKRETRRHQNPSRHEYLIAGSVVKADSFIAVPKMKTHKRAGLTACLKILVGINGEKAWVPHHRLGSVAEGGDEYPDYSRVRSLKAKVRELQISHPALWKVIYRSFQALSAGRSKGGFQSDYGHHASKTIAFGCWYGNDTLWRSIVDLNRILLYSDKSGVLAEDNRRGYFAVVDGIVAGEGEGPLVPKARPCGLIVAGDNPLATDTVISRVMGFDPEKIPQLSGACSFEEYSLCRFDGIEVRSNNERWESILRSRDKGLSFEASGGWKGHIELE